MTLPILRDDALTASVDGFAVHVSLPWIRSLPLSSVSGVRLHLDGEECAVDVPDGDGWWFVQDRLALRGRRPLSAGPHSVAVSFRLLIPYLPAGPDAPLVLDFAGERRLEAVAETPWTLAASAFNWTPEVIRAERPAADIAVGIVASGVSRVVELEPGQLWRSFPITPPAEAADLRDRIAAAGGRVGIVGASLDDWVSPTRRRDDDERLAFLLPQLRTAHDLGAEGVRLPLGQAGPALLRRVQPVLHELDLTLYEEAQGQQTPEAPAVARAMDDIAEFDDPRVRLLIDTSMLMPALPVTYLAALAPHIPDALRARLTDAWLEPETLDAVVAHLRSGAVPPAAHALYMNLLVRFGRSPVEALRGILPLIGAFHLKFWDLDDADDRVSRPLRDLGALLRDAAAGFAGTLCSEWGGHEWLDEDPTQQTRAHLALASASL
ncbi:restriction endonuclease subunit R [Leifsonia sp. Leaf336]|uniref:restriction endonuclease subunit R n=1 Tax=Leifsonia sp. Leaf336 TaxID=1736341 RepID=UPI000A6FFE00|nr:restriction endonuclease subunit R [Leifsonia sp. Leaf336]